MSVPDLPEPPRRIVRFETVGMFQLKATLSQDGHDVRSLTVHAKQVRRVCGLLRALGYEFFEWSRMCTKNPQGPT